MDTYRLLAVGEMERERKWEKWGEGLEGGSVEGIILDLGNVRALGY